MLTNTSNKKRLSLRFKNGFGSWNLYTDINFFYKFLTTSKMREIAKISYSRWAKYKPLSHIVHISKNLAKIW